MRLNPTLRRLGYSADARVLIVHADDVGLCEATVEALTDLAAAELPVSASVMAPGPAFREAAALSRAAPHLDVGVHLTLSSEHEAWRWGPVETSDPLPGLVGDDGLFLSRPEPLRTGVAKSVLRLEAETQIERVRGAGVEATHLDLHMGCLMTPRLLPLYLDLAIASSLPALVWWPLNWPVWSFAPEDIGPATRAIAAYRRRGMPVFNHVVELPLGEAIDPDERRARFRGLVEGLPPGLSLLYAHPATDTAELRSFTRDWRARVADHELLRDPETYGWLRREGVDVVVYRELGRTF